MATFDKSKSASRKRGTEEKIMKQLIRAAILTATLLIMAGFGLVSAQDATTFHSGDTVAMNVESYLRVAPASAAGLLAPASGNKLPVGTQLEIIDGPFSKPNAELFYWVQLVDPSPMLGVGYIEASKLNLVKAANDDTVTLDTAIAGNGAGGQQNAATVTCAGENTIHNATGTLTVTQGQCNSFYTFDTAAPVTFIIPVGGFAHAWNNGVVTEWVNDTTNGRTVTTGTSVVDAIRIFGTADKNGSAFNRDAELKKLVDYLNATYSRTGGWTEVRGQ